MILIEADYEITRFYDIIVLLNQQIFRLTYLETIFQWICRIDQVCSNTCQVAASCDHWDNSIEVSNFCCLFDYTLEETADKAFINEYFADFDLSPVMESSKFCTCTCSAW